jgi:hypothetical protein
VGGAPITTLDPEHLNEKNRTRLYIPLRRGAIKGNFLVSFGYPCAVAAFTFSFTFSPRFEENNSKPGKQELSENGSELDECAQARDLEER